MIRKTCDSCERTIEVDDGLAGQRVACEACGDINVMPHAGGTGQTAAAGDRASTMGLPPDDGPEQAALKVRPAMLRARPGFFLAHLLVLAGGVVGVVWGLMDRAETLRMVALVGGGIGAIAALGSLGVWKIQTLSAALEITNKRTVLRRGLLSRATSEVVHDNIRNVQVTQTFWQRVWRVGSLGLSSSGQDGIEIEIGDIPNPDRVREVIDAYRPLG